MNIFFKSKLVSLKHEIDVTDESGDKLYELTSRFISITDKTSLINAKTNAEIASIHRKPVSIHEIYYVEMADGTKFELTTEIFKIVEEQIDIEGLGWKIVGNMLQHDFDVVDETGVTVASSHKSWVSLHEAYQVNVADETKLDKIVAIYATLDHIIQTREKNENDAPRNN